MSVIAIDPGEKESAIVMWTGKDVVYHDFGDNWKILDLLSSGEIGESSPLVVEWLEGYGLTVGQSVFETCRWVGMFQHAWISLGRDTQLLSRRRVKQLLCNNVSAKDSHVREALIDKIGPVGTKKSPGPMFGITSHKIAALAVGYVWWEQNCGGENV